MSIRYECDQCGSVLKIKLDLAGKPGKCPKCKTPFTVPSLGDETDSSSEIPASEPLDDGESTLAEAQSSASGDFDVDAFLSGDGDAGAAARPKATKKPPRQAESELSDDEPEETPKPKRSKSKADGEGSEEAFQIRRGPDAPGKSGSTLGSIDGSEEPVVARRPPGTNANAPASNIASDLLSKSSKKGKKTNWDEPDPTKADGPAFDWESLRYEARTKLLPVLAGGAVVGLLIYFLLAPMFSSRSHVPKLGTVTGVISVNGKPLAGAHVMFHPKEKKHDSGGKDFHVTASVAETDATGRYDMKYGENRGAVIGMCRVEIMCTDYTGINPKYFKPKEEARIVEVKAGKQVINLELSE